MDSFTNLCVNASHYSIEKFDQFRITLSLSLSRFWSPSPSLLDGLLLIIIILLIIYFYLIFWIFLRVKYIGQFPSKYLFYSLNKCQRNICLHFNFLNIYLKKKMIEFFGIGYHKYLGRVIIKKRMKREK